MPAPALYLGEQNGARVLRYGRQTPTRVTDVGTQAVNVELETWDVVPLDVIGDCLFRLIGGVVRYTNGFDVEVTPSVDGQALAPQRFTGQGAGEYTLEAVVTQRGARCSVWLRTLSRLGDIEFDRFVVSYVPIRITP